MTRGFSRFLSLRAFSSRSLTTVTNQAQTESSILDYTAARPYNEIPKLSTLKTLWDMTADNTKKHRLDKVKWEINCIIIEFLDAIASPDYWNKSEIVTIIKANNDIECILNIQIRSKTLRTT